MRTRDVIWILVAINGISVLVVSKRAETRGYLTAKRHYENLIDSRVAQGIAGYQRVQVLREKSEYRRGWESCQDQF